MLHESGDLDSLLTVLLQEIPVAFPGTVYVVTLLHEQYSSSSMHYTKYWKKEDTEAFSFGESLIIL